MIRNTLSIPAARAAVENARQSGLPAASAGFRLTQQPGAENQVGIVIYKALYTPRTPTEAQRASSLRGVVFVTLRMDDLLRALVPALRRSCHRGRYPARAAPAQDAADDTAIGGLCSLRHGRSAVFPFRL